MAARLARREVVLSMACGLLLCAVWWMWAEAVFAGTARSLAVVHGTVLLLAVLASWGIGRTTRRSLAAFGVMVASFAIAYLVAAAVARAVYLADCDDVAASC